MSTIHQIIGNINQQLAGMYPEPEIESFIRILFGYFLNMSSVQIHSFPDKEIGEIHEMQILNSVDELKRYCPIQYIIGETEFYGLKFQVTPDVLIPRPETEELVDWIVHEYNKIPNDDSVKRILDIGTGSGCIAISLARNIPKSEVWAIDNSGAAMTIASCNISSNKVKVCMVVDDILIEDDKRFSKGYFDIIVSNPPYVTPAEKSNMQSNVLNYEPHRALFTPEDDPLIFYKKIAHCASIWLNKGGRLFFEINEAFSEEVSDVLKQYNFSDITPRKDINGKWRMISARRE